MEKFMTSNNIIFKKISENDLKLLQQWFQIPHILKWYARDEIYSFEMIQEKYLPRIGDPTIQSYIIYDHDQSVGYIQIYHVNSHLPEGVINYHHPLFNDFKPNTLAGIDLFIADENYLHTGFSSKVLKEFIKVYINGKFSAVLVDPVKQNITAISFFEKNGFKHIMSHDSHHDLMLLRMGSNKI